MTNLKDIEMLFREHYAQMCRLAVAYLHDDDIARDIVHDVFASLADVLPRVPVTQAYLMRAVKNRCINEIRNTGVHQRVHRLYLIETLGYDADEWPDEATVAAIHFIIRTELTPACRRVMELRFGDGLKFSEIAETMGISQNAVFKHLRHAIVVIREKIKRNESSVQ